MSIMRLPTNVLLLVVVYITCSFVTWAQDMDIRMPPTITRSPTTQVTYRHDERIPLECRATGAGQLTYEWTKNQIPMNLNEFSRLEVEAGGQTVIIKSAARLDEGFYQCIVSSAYGKALSNTSHLQLATVGDAASKEILPLTVQEGQPFEIRAQPHKSFPRPTYNWEMATSTEDTSPKKVFLNGRVQMDEDGNLHFAYATMDDAINGNIYKLITFNQYLDQKLGGSYTRVSVEPAKDGVKNFPPIARFSTIPSYVGVVGRNISLRCFFAARPEATYTWRTPDSAKRFYDFQNPLKTELFIRDIKPEDEGNYICSASNTEGRQELKLQLEVQSAPEYKKPEDRLKNINATEGDTVTFRCYTEGKPQVNTVWYMNGKIINKDSVPRRMRFSRNNQDLYIENVCRDCPGDDPATDLMVIQCNSSNVHGYVLGTGYLNILKKTVVTSMSDQDNVEVKRDEARSVVFKCQAASDPSTPVKIEWRKVDLDDPDNDFLVHPDNKVIFIDQGQITFVVEQNNTEKWLEIMGRYRCKASNSYSADFKVMTLTVEDIPIVSKTGGIADMWWIFLIIALLLLLLILLLCCCIYCQRNRGDSYPVDEKERMNGNDVEKEIEDNGFHDYKRPEGQPLRSTGGSLSSSTKLNSDDEGSLNEYGDVDPGKFTEDGSFVGAYTNTADRKRGRSES